MGQINDTDTYPIKSTITGTELAIGSDGDGGPTINLELNKVSDFIKLEDLPNNFTNKVFVNSEADFGSASGGFIDLVDDTLYVIEDNITFTNTLRIPASGKIYFETHDTSESKKPQLLYLGVGNAIQGTSINCFVAKKLVFVNPVPGSKLLNLTGDGLPDGSASFENCFFISNQEIGLIDNFDIVLFRGAVLRGWTQGFTIYNPNNFVLLNSNIEAGTDLGGTAFDFPDDVANTVEIGNVAVNIFEAAATETIFNIASGVTLTNQLGIKIGTFIGAGNFFHPTGQDYKSNNVVVTSLEPIPNSRASCFAYLDNAATLTTITNSNIDYPIEIAVSGILEDTDVNQKIVVERHVYIDGEPGNVDHPDGVNAITGRATARFTYSGIIQNQILNCIASVSATKTGTTRRLEVSVYKNGVQSVGTMTTGQAGTDPGRITIPFKTSLNPDDYIEFWVRNTENTDSLNFEVGQITIAGE